MSDSADPGALGARAAHAASAGADLEALRARLREAEDTLRAIRLGEADALMVQGPDGPRVYTLVSADHSYRMLVEQMSEAALMLGDRGIILYSNGRLSQLLDYQTPMLVGRPLGELVVPDDLPTLEDLLEQGRGSEAEGEIRLQPADGDPVPVHLSLAPVQTPGFNGIGAVVTDLTENLRRAKAAERERLTDAVLQFTDAPIIVCDAQGRVIRANPAALELCQPDAIGRGFEEALPLGVDYDTVRQGPPGEPQEFRLKLCAGDERYVVVRARRIGNGAPEEGWWVITLTDVSARRRGEEALRRAKEVAEAANQAKSDFLSVMSHELRTPLNSVMGYTDLLLLGTSGSLSDTQRRHAERIQASAKHQLSLIEEILSYARIEAGHDELRLDVVGVARMIQEVAEFVRPQTQNKGLGLEVAVPAADPLEIVTDPGKLRQVLLNLLGNATKFTQRGSIAIAAGWDADRLLVQVRDTGPGIPSQRLDDIWQPFTQLDASATRENSGTGLGLAIVRQLIQLMSGTIELDTAVGQGSTFTLRLPRVCPLRPS